MKFLLMLFPLIYSSATFADAKPAVACDSVLSISALEDAIRSLNISKLVELTPIIILDQSLIQARGPNLLPTLQQLSPETIHELFDYLYVLGRIKNLNALQFQLLEKLQDKDRSKPESVASHLSINFNVAAQFLLGAIFDRPEIPKLKKDQVLQVMGDVADSDVDLMTQSHAEIALLRMALFAAEEGTLADGIDLLSRKEIVTPESRKYSALEIALYAEAGLRFAKEATEAMLFDGATWPKVHPIQHLLLAAIIPLSQTLGSPARFIEPYAVALSGIKMFEEKGLHEAAQQLRVFVNEWLQSMSDDEREFCYTEGPKLHQRMIQTLKNK